MNVASLELCKELYELSGWEHGPERSYYIDPELPRLRDIRELTKPEANTDYHIQTYYEYDLGYLLRKLPLTTWLHNHQNGWSAHFEGMRTEHGGVYLPFIADTPEDAAAKLAIELFKQGILTNTGKGE